MYRPANFLRPGFLRAATLLALLVCLVLPAARAVGADGAAAAALRNRIEAGDSIAVRGLLLDRATLAKVYAARSFAPLWEDNPAWGPALIAALASAGVDGLSPDILLPAAMRRAIDDPSLDAVDRELLLSDRFLAYASILARGQTDPGSHWSDWGLLEPRFDPIAAAVKLAEGAGPDATLQSLRPPSPDYGGLQKALAFYVGIAADGGWATLPSISRLKPGATGQAVKELRLRLASEGYLTAAQTSNPLFDGDLAQAVILFQRRHGLDPDGAVGPLTLAALNVSAAQRADQIRINLERWREMPRLWPASRLEINVPAQMLSYYRDGKVALTSRVIVGDVRHHTPVLAAAVERVILDPAWEIPVSIIANEIQPRLRRDPGYLARTHTVILGRNGGDPYGQDVDWSHTRILARGWRLRQLPGAWNALGSVVLDMPNRFDVYLHDTPARNLFARTQRALSHGCIRVEEVRVLAASLLGLPALPPAGGPTRAVELPAPIAVYLLYQTAFIDQEGAIEFRDDIYGRDEALARLLAAPTPSAPGALAVAETSCPGIPGALAGLAP